MSNYLGKKIKEIREGKSMLLRQIASSLEVDTALISKIEKGDRKPNKNQVVKIAELFDINADELLLLWMADKINRVIANDTVIGFNAIDFLKNDKK